MNDILQMVYFPTEHVLHPQIFVVDSIYSSQVTST